jgi:hypothetical protein
MIRSVSANVRDMECLMSSLTWARKYLPKRGVARRYGVTSRTVDRWKKRKVIPPPDLRRNNREYWLEEALDHHDRQCVAARADIT